MHTEVIQERKCRVKGEVFADSREKSPSVHQITIYHKKQIDKVKKKRYNIYKVGEGYAAWQKKT